MSILFSTFPLKKQCCSYLLSAEGPLESLSLNLLLYSLLLTVPEMNVEFLLSATNVLLNYSFEKGVNNYWMPLDFDSSMNQN